MDNKTTIIKMTLTDAAAGTWTSQMGFPMVTGVPLNGRVGWDIAGALQSQVESWLRTNGLEDALVIAIDPDGTDLGELARYGEELCSFRLVGGEFSVLI